MQDKFVSLYIEKESMRYLQEVGKSKRRMAAAKYKRDYKCS
jgi:hypothetical protein